MQRMTKTGGSIPAPSWSAIGAGVLVALAAQLTLGAFAGALGGAAPASDSAGLGVVAGLLALAVVFAAYGAGAWLAVRVGASLHPLGAKLHGVLVWAIALLVTAPLSALGARLEMSVADGARGAAAAGFTALVALAGALAGATRGRRDALGGAVAVGVPRVERRVRPSTVDVEDRWRDETHAH